VKGLIGDLQHWNIAKAGGLDAAIYHSIVTTWAI
jgi:hypothetical protein